jgi:hypothetical protein
MTAAPMSAAPMSAVPMSAAPIFLPYVSTSAPLSRTGAVPPPAGARTAEAPASLRLTDRGIAVIMVVAGVIMTVALVVIGLTAMRVTSADYDADSYTSAQAHN